MSKLIGVDGRTIESDATKAERVEARKLKEARIEFAMMLEAAGLLMGCARVPKELAEHGMNLDQYQNYITKCLIELVGKDRFEQRFKVKYQEDSEPMGTERANDATEERVAATVDEIRRDFHILPKARRH